MLVLVVAGPGPGPSPESRARALVPSSSRGLRRRWCGPGPTPPESHGAPGATQSDSESRTVVKQCNWRGDHDRRGLPRSRRAQASAFPGGLSRVCSGVLGWHPRLGVRSGDSESGFDSESDSESGRRRPRPRFKFRPQADSGSASHSGSDRSNPARPGTRARDSHCRILTRTPSPGVSQRRQSAVPGALRQLVLRFASTSPQVSAKF